jgi:hypothetical protein
VASEEFVHYMDGPAFLKRKLALAWRGTGRVELWTAQVDRCPFRFSESI